MLLSITKKRERSTSVLDKFFNFADLGIQEVDVLSYVLMFVMLPYAAML